MHTSFEVRMALPGGFRYTGITHHATIVDSRVLALYRGRGYSGWQDRGREMSKGRA